MRPWPPGGRRAKNKQTNFLCLRLKSLSELSHSYINKLLSFFFPLCDRLNILASKSPHIWMQNFFMCARF